MSPDIEVVDTKIEVNSGNATLYRTVDAYWKNMHAEDLTALEARLITVKNHLAVVPTEDFVNEEIAEDIIHSLELRCAVQADNVAVTVQDGEVTLSGVVPAGSVHPRSP